METKPKCVYCQEPRENLDGWHGCKNSLDMKARIEGEIDKITRIINRPGDRPLTSMEMRSREDRRHEIATSLKVAGLPVKEEYDGRDN